MMWLFDGNERLDEFPNKNVISADKRFQVEIVFKTGVNVQTFSHNK